MFAVPVRSGLVGLLLSDREGLSVTYNAGSWGLVAVTNKVGS